MRKERHEGKDINQKLSSLVYEDGTVLNEVMPPSITMEF